jgi:Uma2 family endonuclease
MAMPAIRRRWTAADVRALMNESRAWPRYELIAGELVVTPAPGSAHQLAVLEIAILLAAYVDREALGIVVTSPADLELRPGTITQPDVFVIPADTRIAGKVLQWPDVKGLLLAVEVLSPSSVRLDRVEKRDFYLDSGVAEYWIVDLDARVVERWTANQESPATLRDRLVWEASATPLNIDLPAMFDRIAAKARLIKR